MANRYSNNLPQDYLQKLFIYNADEGVLIWNVQPSIGRKIKGKRFGFDEKGGRRKGMINKKNYRESNLIWMYHYGDIPNGYYVDHKDRNPSNNKLDNLRLATPTQNRGNSDYKNSTSIHKGVFKCGKKWRAMCAGVYYGMFDTEIEAAKIYNKHAFEKWGEFANLNKV